ncbi:MAG: hypothetical protein JWP01_2699 [Myxococcales bacterium]|nr:hypothetical protein [Myxococcales bacterium]
MFALALAGCGFQVAGGAPVGGDADALTDAASDAAIDATPDAAVARFCPVTDTLRVCFSFDPSPLPATLPNEGAATLDAALTSITRIPRSATSGAAQFGATSGISMPMNAGVTGILTSEVWFRIDSMPATNGGRQGLFDSNTTQNISLFVYRADPNHSLRCGMGDQTEVFQTSVSSAAWHYAVCTCENNAMSVYLDGARVGPARPGSCGTGAFLRDGFTIGSDNGGNATVPGDRIIGAIDGVRLWSVARTDVEIGATAASGI